MTDPNISGTSTTGTEMWTSKLGNRYPKAEIEARHHDTMNELHHLLAQGANAVCADCRQTGGRTIWSSVNLGVFLCMHCGSLHRALGTHISKPKGCSGTYLWGPDEMGQMRRVGNARALEMYGDGGAARPPRDAPDAVWLKFLEEKYVQKKYAPRHNKTTTATTAAIATTADLLHMHHHDNHHSATDSSTATITHDTAHAFQDLLDNFHTPHSDHHPTGGTLSSSPRGSINHTHNHNYNATSTITGTTSPKLHSSHIDPHHKPTTNDFFAEFGV